jgi:NitT/TauT family transport system permease protein
MKNGETTSRWGKLDGRFGPLARGLLPLAVLAAAWILAVHLLEISPIFLPPLEDMPSVLWRMFTEEGVTRDLLISIYRVLLGFVLAVALATPIGVLMGYRKTIRQSLSPVLGFFRYIPVPVFIPLTILWFGSGDRQKMIIIFLGAFFQLVLMVSDAARNVPGTYYESATMLGAPRRDLVLRVLWPAALPQIFDSYRIAMGWAWTYLIVAEIVGASTGLGYYIIKAQRYLLIPQIFAAMALIGVLGMLTDYLFSAAHQRLFPWAQRAGGSGDVQ